MNQVLTELKGEIDYIIVGDFNTIYSTISKTEKKNQWRHRWFEQYY